MVTEEDFQILFQKLMNRYELPQETAEKLLVKILFILKIGEECPPDLET